MKYAYSKETKTFKLQAALQAGETITASIAAKRFGIKNITAEVSRIRQNGYVVNTTNRKAGNGVQVTEYSLGHPTREIVALAYRARALGIAV